NGVSLITSGSDAKFALLGGRSVGGMTLNRFYVLHCMAIPLAAALLIMIHFWRVREDGGISRPVLRRVVGNDRFEMTNSRCRMGLMPGSQGVRESGIRNLESDPFINSGTRSAADRGHDRRESCSAPDLGLRISRALMNPHEDLPLGVLAGLG